MSSTMSSTRPHSTHEVSRSPSPDLHDVLLGIQSSLDSLAERILAIESADRARIGTVSMTPAPPPPPSTKGKARAQAAPAPSKAKPAKKERPTKKAPIPSEGLPLHLAQTFPQEGKPDRHLVTVAIPDATAAHVIGQGGKGLKQLHDISGARVSAYTLKSGPRDERHVSIRGTDEQIGDALVVLGKRLARKRVRGPTTKKTVPGPSADWADPAPPRVASKPRAGPSAPPSGQRPSSCVPALGPAAAPPGPSAEKWNPSATAPAFGSGSFTPATSSHGVFLHPPTPTQPYSSTPVSRSQSMGESPASPGPPSVAMASPSPASTAFAPTVAMASPSPSGSVTPASPMDVGAAVTAAPRRQTARRGAPYRGRGT